MVKDGESACFVNCGNGGTIIVFFAPFALTVLGEVAVDMSFCDDSHIHLNAALDINHTSAVSVGAGGDSFIV